MRSSDSPEPGRTRPNGPGSSGPPALGRPGYAGLTVGAFLDALAAAEPAPAAGSAAAVVLAQAAALCAKSARLSSRQLGTTRAGALTAAAEHVRAAATALADADADAYQEVIAAARAVRTTAPAAAPAAADRETAGQEAAGRVPNGGSGEPAAALAAALSRAADVPMEIIELTAGLAETAATLATSGNPRLRGDAETAALLAQAAAKSAARLVDINLAGNPADPRPARAARLLTRMDNLTTRASAGPPVGRKPDTPSAASPAPGN